MFLDASALLGNLSTHRGIGLTAADIDGDGMLEILVTGEDMPGVILKWEKRRLVARADSVLCHHAGHAFAVCAADIDGDGREELMMLQRDQEPGPPFRLLAAFGDRWFDLMQQAGSPILPAPGIAVSALDRFGRGRYGFVISHLHQPMALWELDSQGRLRDRATEAGLDLPVLAGGMVAAPMVSALCDLFVQSRDGSNRLFCNLGDGVFEETAAARGLADAQQHGIDAALLDADGNGLPDLLCATWKGSHRLFLQRAGGGFTDAATADFSRPANTTCVLVADFDNDGVEEVLFFNHGEPNRLFALRHDEWREIEPGDAAEPHGNNRCALVADVDGDGHLEVLVTRGPGTAHPLGLYRVPPNNNSWLRIAPLTSAGAPARGAMVTCVADEVSRRRGIASGSGISQSEPVAHFGLGRAKSVDEVEVRWPDGTSVRVVNPPINRLLSVPYPPE